MLHAADPPTLSHRSRWGRRLLLPVVLVLAWLAWTGAGGPTFGAISEVTTDDQATFLPADAESTRAAELREQFADSDAVPATVIAEHDGGTSGSLDEAAMGEAAELASTLEGLDGVTDVIGPVPAEDSGAVQLIVLLAEDAVDDGAVDALRATVAGELDEAAWSAHVTGPAALSTDLSEAFAGIDGMLLLVAVVAVFLILIVVYRSPFLPLLVLLSSVGALCAAITVVYLMARLEWIQLNGQVQGILSILVIGAATDYSLLLVARYREELLRAADRHAALWTALKRSTPPILASGGTVAVALMCLLFSDLNSNRALGPVAAAGIVFAMVATLSFLPALLALTGRRVFWPRVPLPEGPHADDTSAEHTPSRGLWARVAAWVGAHPRPIWVVVTLVLLVGAAGVTQLRADGIDQSEVVLGETDTKAGQTMLEKHFDAGTGAPTEIFVPAAEADQALELVAGVEGVAEAHLVDAEGAPAGDLAQAQEVDGQVEISATLDSAADSSEAESAVVALRDQLDALEGEALVGGTTATQLDTNTTAQRDLMVIIPIVLVAILVILMVLLRSVVAPVILVVATVLSYLTALGVSALVFNHLFGFPGADPTVPLFGFMFLVALGVDYTIFLMTRAREEALRGDSREGLLHALVVTGGVITSAGLVLAATFAALAVLPLMFMVQLAFLVALGVLIDTFVVRTLLVPAIGVELGRRIWWPSRLAQPAIARSTTYSTEGPSRHPTPV